MNEEIKAASVDSPELEVLLRRVREAKSWDFDDRKAALIAHINAWSDERCNQLAASRAMLPVTDSRLTDDDLTYMQQIADFMDRSSQPQQTGPDSFEFTSQFDYDLNQAASELSSMVAKLRATPVAGWVSVEERLPDCDMKPGSWGVEVLVYPPIQAGEHTAFYGCRCTDEPSFYKYGLTIGSVTHWRELPPAPVTPKQEQS